MRVRIRSLMILVAVLAAVFAALHWLAGQDSDIKLVAAVILALSPFLLPFLFACLVFAWTAWSLLVEAITGLARTSRAPSATETPKAEAPPPE